MTHRPIRNLLGSLELGPDRDETEVGLPTDNSSPLESMRSDSTSFRVGPRRVDPPWVRAERLDPTSSETLPTVGTTDRTLRKPVSEVSHLRVEKSVPGSQ